MILYSAKYRLPGDLLWSRVRRIKGDLIEEGKQILFLNDGRQVHLPLDAVVIFDHRRLASIEQKMERQAGQKLAMR